MAIRFLPIQVARQLGGKRKNGLHRCIGGFEEITIPVTQLQICLLDRAQWIKAELHSCLVPLVRLERTTRGLGN
ncbi:hypothetical protein ACFLT3_01930 [Chloroflexota bacterium]